VPLKHVLPRDPKGRFEMILKVAFGNSPLALARAAGVSRAAVNKWPPERDIWLLDEHLARALDAEISATVIRQRILVDLKQQLLDRMFDPLRLGKWD
jgi:hypothetical protein